MNIFSVYQHPTLGYVAIKRGWSWPGFFFSVIWLLIKRLWKWAAIFIVVFFILSGTGTLIDDEPTQKEYFIAIRILNILLQSLIGLNGNRWRMAEALRNGFAFREEIKASTPDQAIAIAARTRDGAVPFSARQISNS